jgi:uncharacterized OsmC-like protein/TusA-related sulfurtransferase
MAEPVGPVTPDGELDGGDLDCGSGLLLMIRAAMAPLPAGGVLLVKSRETSVREDLPAWCRLVGHSVLAERAVDGGYWHFLLRKKVEDGSLAADLQQAREHRWQTRARWTGGMQAKVTMRNHALVVGQPASFDVEDAAPSAIEYLLTAVGGALATGLQWRLSRQQVTVHNLEVVCRAQCKDPLVFLGLGDTTAPELAAIDVVAYVDSDAEPEALAAAFAETMRRCPVTQTLLRGVPVAGQIRSS